MLSFLMFLLVLLCLLQSYSKTHTYTPDDASVVTSGDHLKWLSRTVIRLTPGPAGPALTAPRETGSAVLEPQAVGDSLFDSGARSCNDAAESS